MTGSIPELKCPQSKKYMQTMGTQFFFRELQVQTQLIKKNCTIIEPNIVNFQDTFAIVCKHFFDLNIMHVWGAVKFRICFEPKYHITQYQPRARTFALTWHNLIPFDFTLSHIYYPPVVEPLLLEARSLSPSLPPPPRFREGHYWLWNSANKIANFASSGPIGLKIGQRCGFLLEIAHTKSHLSSFNNG